MTPAVFKAALDAVPTFDVSEMLQDVKAPTLVFSRPNISWIPTESAKNLTAKIPYSQLSILDGESTAPYLGDSGTVIATLQHFLDADDRTSSMAREVKSPAVTGTHISEPTSQDTDAPLLSGLTERETQVLRMVAGGRTNNQVAAELVLSIRTVERHIGNIYSKIDARGRADATVYALTHGLV